MWRTRWALDRCNQVVTASLGECLALVGAAEVAAFERGEARSSRLEEVEVAHTLAVSCQAVLESMLATAGSLLGEVDVLAKAVRVGAW